MYIFLGIDVDNQFAEIKNKATIIDKNIGFKNSCFTLPSHISLKASFKSTVLILIVLLKKLWIITYLYNHLK